MMQDASPTRPPFVRDLLAGLFFLAWAAAGWIAVLDSRVFTVDTGRDPGPALMPVAVLVALSLGGAGIIATALVRALRRRPATAGADQGDGVDPTLRQHGAAMALLASLLVFPTVMRVVGYPAATAAFVFFWVLVLTPRHLLAARRGGLKAVAVAAAAATVVSAIIYVGFVLVIRVPLP